MKLCQDYLSARGITDETVKIYGLELDERISQKTALDRLGRRLPKGVIEVIWIPLCNSNGKLVGWIARLLPEVCGPDGKLIKFLCPTGSAGMPFIPESVWKARKRTDNPIITTEGPPKALVLSQAGSLAIALSGVWMGTAKNGDGRYALRLELLDFSWLGRNVYLCFDADQSSNQDVLQAMIRTAFALTVEGAVVWQLTTWPLSEGKGIDDYLAGKAGIDPAKQKDSLDALISGAQRFFDTLQPFMLPVVEAELQKVAMSSAARAQLCRILAGPLGVRASVLEESFVVGAQPAQGLSYAEDYEPWPDPVNAEDLFNEVMVSIQKEAIVEAHQLYVNGLWTMFTWVHPQMEFSPLLYITAPTLLCGKTTLLNVIGKMVRRPVKTSNVSAPAVFRLSQLYHPTFLMDEAQDQLKNPDLALVIKSGHTPGEYAIRCDPNTNDPVPFDVFCPKLLAGIGRANAQLMSRSIIITMERKKGVQLDRSVKINDPIFVELRRKLARWAADAGDLTRFTLPKNNAGAEFRDADNWQALYRVACAISPDVAKQLIEHIPNFIDKEQDFDTYLLSSLRNLYRDECQDNHDGFIGSVAIVATLNQDLEAPWYGKDSPKGITVHALGRRLGRYKVKAAQTWIQQADVRGYYYQQKPADKPQQKTLKSVFDQYLSPITP